MLTVIPLALPLPELHFHCLLNRRILFGVRRRTTCVINAIECSWIFVISGAISKLVAATRMPAGANHRARYSLRKVLYGIPTQSAVAKTIESMRFTGHRRLLGGANAMNHLRRSLKIFCSRRPVADYLLFGIVSSKLCRV